MGWFSQELDERNERVVDIYDPDLEETLDAQRKARAEYPNLRRGMKPLDPDDEPSFLGCSSREDLSAIKERERS